MLTKNRCYKTFCICNLQMLLVFVLYMSFQLSPTPESSTFQVLHSCLGSWHQLESDAQYSLLRTFINYRCKRFYNIGSTSLYLVTWPVVSYKSFFALSLTLQVSKLECSFLIKLTLCLISCLGTYIYLSVSQYSALFGRLRPYSQILDQAKKLDRGQTHQLIWMEVWKFYKTDKGFKFGQNEVNLSEFECQGYKTFFLRQ